MIVGFGMYGYGKYVLGFFGKMLKDGIKLDEVIFVVFFFVCVYSGFVFEGRKLFDKMIDEYGVEC